MVTSRERLRLSGEHVYPVPQLTAPEGLDLFAARVAALDPAFQASPAVLELCERLDNLPLALELAAARCAVLTPEQILDRLGDRLDLLKGGRDSDPRQQTLRATIAWSSGLLDPDERDVFARFAVFAGSAPLDAVENVCATDVETLASLVDKSLITRDGDRYRMLETIREYGVEQTRRRPTRRGDRAPRNVLRAARPRRRGGPSRAGHRRLARDCRAGAAEPKGCDGTRPRARARRQSSAHLRGSLSLLAGSQQRHGRPRLDRGRACRGRRRGIRPGGRIPLVRAARLLPG